MKNTRKTLAQIEREVEARFEAAAEALPEWAKQAIEGIITDAIAQKIPFTPHTSLAAVTASLLSGVTDTEQRTDYLRGVGEYGTKTFDRINAEMYVPLQPSERVTVRVTMDNGDSFITPINLSFDQAKAYYLGRVTVTEDLESGVETRRTFTKVELV